MNALGAITHCTANMLGDWVEIFDATKASNRADLKGISPNKIVTDLAETFNSSSMAVPATIGHTSSYPKDTRVPAGAWVDEVKSEGNKLFCKFRLPKPISAAIPPEFRELAGMPEFFKEAVNNGHYESRSVGFFPDQNIGGKLRLHHVAFLGAKQPEIKGMPKCEFTEQEPDRFFEFSSGVSVTEITTMAQPKFSATDLKKLRELADTIAIDGVTEGDPDAVKELDQLMDALRECYSLPPEANIGQILGAVQAEQAEAKAAAAAAAGVANAIAPIPLSMYNDLNTKVKTMENNMRLVAKTLKEFADASTPAQTAATPNTATDSGADAGAQAGTIDAIPLTPEQITSQVQAAMDALKQAKVWMPAWDEGTDGSKFADLLGLLAKVKFNSGSALDSLSGFLTALPAVAELAEFTKVLNIEQVREYSEGTKGGGVRKLDVAIPAGSAKTGEDVWRQCMEYSEAHGVSYEEAAQRLGV